MWGVGWGVLLSHCRTVMSVSTHQQDSYCHHGSGAGGHCAVHQDDMIFTDVFGQTQVMQLTRPARKRPVTTRTGQAVTMETSCGFQKQIHKTNLLLFVVYNGKRHLVRSDSFFGTSGSPESRLVWMRILPIRTSLHTALRAGSMVSPARRMDTPVICGEKQTEWVWWLKPRENTRGRDTTHPFPVVATALVPMALWGLNHTQLLEDTQNEFYFITQEPNINTLIDAHIGNFFLNL